MYTNFYFYFTIFNCNNNSTSFKMRVKVNDSIEFKLYTNNLNKLI